MKKLMIALIASVACSVASAADSIRFAAEASYPPFEFIDANNQMQGFDIDLAKALCKELEADCSFINQAFDSLIPGLKFRRFDAVISGMDITPERQQQVTFTRPYYENSAQFIAQHGKFADLAALKGQRVGVQNGTTHQRFLQEQHPEIITVPYDSYQNALLDLKNGRLAAVFGDTAVVNEWLKQNDTLATLGEKVTDPNYFGIGLGIAVRLNNHELANKLDGALQKLQQDGTYQAIYQKWFQ